MCSYNMKVGRQQAHWNYANQVNLYENSEMVRKAKECTRYFLYVLKHPDLCLDGAVKETDIISMFFLKFLNADCSSLSYDGY